MGWYFEHIYRRTEGPGTVPSYCDAERVGQFAVDRSELAAGSEPALFKLFVAMSMFQARRDVLILEQQRGTPARAVRLLTSMTTVRGLVQRSACRQLASSAAFDAGCSVGWRGNIADCAHRPGAACHVKESSVHFGRMGDTGKLPSSAWLHAWKEGGLSALLDEICRTETDPQRRAEALVTHFSRVHRVGTKLATMFVSALSTPALAPGLTPWFPRVDGSGLVVVDTHVARAVDALRAPGAAKTYLARAAWLRRQAGTIDLREFGGDAPMHSPRLVQQALYAFGSKSNRTQRGDACRARSEPCASCVPELCPFTVKSSKR